MIIQITWRLSVTGFPELIAKMYTVTTEYSQG